MVRSLSDSIRSRKSKCDDRLSRARVVRTCERLDGAWMEFRNMVTSRGARYLIGQRLNLRGMIAFQRSIELHKWKWGGAVVNRGAESDAVGRRSDAADTRSHFVTTQTTAGKRSGPSVPLAIPRRAAPRLERAAARKSIADRRAETERQCASQALGKQNSLLVERVARALCTQHLRRSRAPKSLAFTRAAAWSLSDPGCGRKDLQEKMSPRETNTYEKSTSAHFIRVQLFIFSNVFVQLGLVSTRTLFLISL